MTRENYNRMKQLKMVLNSTYGMGGAQTHNAESEKLFQEYKELIKEFQNCKGKIED